MTRGLLRDHPALRGRSVTEEWRKHRDYRLLLMREKSARYSRQMMPYRKQLKLRKKLKERGLPQGDHPIRPLNPFEFERSLCVVPIYPLNYLMNQ